MTLYVANLARDITEKELEEKFRSFGTVVSVKIIRSFLGGASKGFGFVRMSNPVESEKAIRGLNGLLLHDRKMTVAKARTGHDRRSADRRGRDRRASSAGSRWKGQDKRNSSRRAKDRRGSERRKEFRETGRTRER